MTKLPNPNSKTAGIYIAARNDQERDLIQKFRGVLRKDNQEYMDFFKPFIEIKVQADNPQLHFVKTSDTLVLSKNLPEVKPAEKITCTRCGGEGCQHCAQLGYYYEESAP